MNSPVSARSRAQLVASGASVALGAVPVLTEVSLVVTRASRWAVVGENGAGKSTLLHTLAGSRTPDSGSVTRVGTLGLAGQEMSTVDGRTVGEVVARVVDGSVAVLEELDHAARALAESEDGAQTRYAAALERAQLRGAWDAERRVQVALDTLGAETDRSRRLDELSVGQRYRVRLACLLGAGDDFLLLDEPTNHLDRTGLDYLTARLRERDGGVVIVSHDRALLADLADNVLDLDPTPDGRPRSYGDGYPGYRRGRRAGQAGWEQEYERQQAEQARLRDDLSAAQNRLSTGWRPDKGTGKHQRATRAPGLVRTVHRRQADLEAQAVPVPEPPRRFRFPALPTRQGAPLLSADGLTVTGRLGPATSLVLHGGSRLVVTGPNGAGKSTLLSVLAGLLAPDTGRVHTAEGARVALLPQESCLPVRPRASELFAAHADQFAERHGDDGVSLTSLRLLRPDETGQRVGALSMGQQRRLALALALLARSHVLLLDEPTNHLSIALVDELTDALRVTEAAVVLCTHDRQLLRDVRTWPRLTLRTAIGSPTITESEVPA